MKKKLESPEAVLARAEQLAGRGSYQAALKDFEKASKVLKHRDIQDKIKTCRRELERLRSKDLIKRGRRHVGKKNYRKALQCFEEAYAISDDDWLKEKIDGLKQRLDHRDALQAAERAEAAGQFDRAADLYGQASGGRAKEEVIIRRACCLVKAGKECDANRALKDLPSIVHERERWPVEIISDRRLIYDYGFALARIGRYYECLKAWDCLKSDDGTFLEQGRRVRNRLQANLYERLGDSESPRSSDGLSDSEEPGSPDGSINSAEWAAMLEEGGYLKETAGWHGGEDFMAFCRLACIARLWKKDEHEAVKKLLLPYPEQMSSPLLALYAKAFFKLADMSEQNLSGLQLFWLSAMYDHGISSTFSAIPAQSNEIRKALIQEAEGLIKKYVAAGSLSAKRTLARWEVEKKLVEDLRALVPFSGELSGLVCTPTFAHTFGSAKQMIELIKENRDSFSDEESYLHAGSYYSSAGNSLLYLAGGEYVRAMEALPGSQERGFAEYRELEDYGIGRVKFAYGIHLLDTGGESPERYFKTSSFFSRKSPETERELISRAAGSENPDELKCYEKILHDMYSERQTDRIAEALSLVMSKRAILMYNEDRINVKALQRSMAHALELDAENEVARSTLYNTGCEGELEELDKALISHKMSRAVRIADRSEHPEVREAFFDFIDVIFHEIDDVVEDNEETLSILNELYKWCARVDGSHPLLDDINGRIKTLEQRK